MSTNSVKSLNDGGTEAPNAAESTLSDTEIHSILSNERRRLFLEALLEEDDGQAEFAELVDVVASIEFAKPIDELDRQNERHTVRVSLYQSHLPRLKKDGVVEYDRRSGTIRLGPNADSVIPFLNVPRSGLVRSISTVASKISLG